MQSANAVRIDSHAAATLRYIRASMDAAASVAVPGSAGLAMGSIGLLAMVASSTASLHEYWIAVWLVAAVLGGGVGSALMTRPASLRGLSLYGTPLRKFAMGLFPALVGGAVMTVVHWTNGNLHSIPGTWLLFYGCALISASVSANRMIAIMGVSFAALGLLALVAPDRLQILLLGAGFGGLHVLFGLLIGREGHEREIY
jgi:predicted phage tail protein